MFSKKVQLSLVSFLILFLELVLIKFIGTEIRIFAYVPNLILLATFIGSGLGFLLKREIPVFHSAASLIVIVVASSMDIFKIITLLLTPISDSYVWYPQSSSSPGQVLLGFFLTIIIFLTVMYIFIPLGQLLSNLFEESKNINISYSINILFSLLGILAFNLFSYLTVSPYVSILLALLIITLLTNRKQIIYSVSISLVLLPFLIISLFSKQKVVWSPYQKLQLVGLPAIPYLPSGKMLQVNNVGYMGLLDLSKEYQKGVVEKLKDFNVLPQNNQDLKYRNQYDLPYIVKSDADSVLLIGAGGGNDASGAIRAGIEDITAVEIDPEIIEFGIEHHPEKPYQNQNVKIINDDGRAYLRRTSEKFDIVVMGLTDSHTLNSSMTNIQLDNFLYTRESLQDVYEVLEEDGLLFLTFEVRASWIGQRIKDSIENAFGQQPLIITTQADPPIFGWGGVYFMVSKDDQLLEKKMEEEPVLRDFIASRTIDYQNPNKKLTDNWPYLYLSGPKIPRIHLIVSFILISLFFSIFYATNTIKKFDLPAFSMGAAFLLYEFQNIGRTSLIYGNTWKTNVFIISAILILILLANMLYLKIKVPFKISFAFLVLSFMLQIVLPVDLFIASSNMMKYTILPILLNLPLFFAGLMFIELFEGAKERKSFYASNLLGSAVGGLVSYLSYVFGIEALIYISLVFYAVTVVGRFKKV